MTKSNKETEVQSVNMKIDVECWKKVGILAAAGVSTKRNIVETAINQYYDNMKKFIS